MGNPTKRAKRAKAKAKQARINKQQPKKSEGFAPSPEVIDLFSRLPHPFEEQECMAQIHEFVMAAPVTDKEAGTSILYSMYCEWHASR